MNIISFSLWGNNPCYFKGALENIKLSKEYYPGWICRFYIHKDCDQKWIKQIENIGSEIVIIEKSLGLFHGMFWRFFVNDDASVENYICRDCDSRLNSRESEAVKEWIESDKKFHTMHDHPAHRKTPILGGMWGCKANTIIDISKQISDWNQFHCKGIDQLFLEKIIWPQIKDNCFRHVGYCLDANKYGSFRPFPKHDKIKNNGTYVGEIFDENNKPNISDLQRLRRYFK